MDDPLGDKPITSEPMIANISNSNSLTEEIEQLRSDFQSRLVVANLRTEAVRAGMIDLDGLKLINLSDTKLGADDSIVGGREMMDRLRRTKPWLFGTSSSSSTAAAPASQPVRQKTALEMTEDEYVTARAALTKRRYS